MVLIDENNPHINQCSPLYKQNNQGEMITA